jgi:hypothetical protein
MFTHPGDGSQLDRQRRREMLAQVHQQRLGRQLRQLARASRHGERDQRRQRRAWRSALRLRIHARA